MTPRNAKVSGGRGPSRGKKSTAAEIANFTLPKSEERWRPREVLSKEERKKSLSKGAHRY